MGKINLNKSCLIVFKPIYCSNNSFTIKEDYNYKKLQCIKKVTFKSLQ